MNSKVHKWFWRRARRRIPGKRNAIGQVAPYFQGGSLWRHRTYPCVTRTDDGTRTSGVYLHTRDTLSNALTVEACWTLLLGAFPPSRTELLATGRFRPHRKNDVQSRTCPDLVRVVHLLLKEELWRLRRNSLEKGRMGNSSRGGGAPGRWAPAPPLSPLPPQPSVLRCRHCGCVSGAFTSPARSCTSSLFSFILLLSAWPVDEMEETRDQGELGMQTATENIRAPNVGLSAPCCTVNYSLVLGSCSRNGTQTGVPLCQRGHILRRCSKLIDLHSN